MQPLQLIETFEALHSRLSSACSQHAVPGAAIVLVGEEETCTAAFGTDADGTPFTDRTPMSTGCVAKLLVSTLVGALIGNRVVGLDDEVGRHLDLPTSPGGYLGSITIRQLLSHTDGIGYRGLESMPTTDAGFIDLRRLSSAVDSDVRTFDGGRFCSEGHCGFGLLGALVERYMEAPLADSLNHELLDRLDGSSPASHGVPSGRVPGPVCPASGTGLAANAFQLGQFLRMHVRPDAFELPLVSEARSLSQLFERQAAYPGWSPSTTGCALGWKTFADEWIGHNGMSSGSTMFVRLHPARKAALAFLCRAHAPVAYAAFADVLGDLLPELSRHDAPRVLTQEERAAHDVAAYIGSFGNRYVQIRICGDSMDTLQVFSSRSTRVRSQSGQGHLVAAANHSFFVRQPNTTGLFFLQYLRSDPTGPLDLLWDIRTLWRRSDGRLA